jgi:Fe-S cluster assembly protein SufA/iron-sulfur cluster assembly protein
MSVATFDPGVAAVTMTEAALRHFEKTLAGQTGKLVRLSTETSGCTGYAYVLNLVDNAAPDDIVQQFGKTVTLAIDRQAMAMLKGTEIDLVVQGVNSVIKFNNPNVVAECGCGESFSVG